MAEARFPLDQFIRRQGQIAEAFASRIEDAVGDGGGDPGNADFPNASRPDAVDMRVGNIQKFDRNIRYVGV